MKPPDFGQFIAKLSITTGPCKKVRLFCKSFQKKEKIFIKLILYPDLADNVYKKLWSNNLNIPLSQFKRSAIILGRHPTKHLSYGICSIEVSSRKIKEKIITWFGLYQKYVSEKYMHLI